MLININDIRYTHAYTQCKNFDEALHTFILYMHVYIFFLLERAAKPSETAVVH